MLPHPLERELRILGSLREAASEIVEAARQPRVVLAQTVQAQRDELVRKKLGQRRSDRFEMRAGGDQLHVGLYREARGRKEAVAAESVLARQPGSFEQFQPLFDAARFRPVAIMIEKALAPGEAERGIRATCEDGGVLDRNAALIEVAVKRPCLQLTACQLALVHQQVKRMLVVIALFADD